MFLERLVAGALLKFNGEVDSVDIIILSNLLKKNIVDDNFKIINKYFKYQYNKYQFKDNYNFDTVLKNNCTIKECLDNLQGEDLKDFFSQLDLKEFILRKIKYLNEIQKDYIDSMYTYEELKIARELLNENFIFISWVSNDDSFLGDYQAFEITKKGNLYLFMKDNKVQIDSFREELLKEGCNIEYLSMYFENIYLDRPLEIIFNVENFKIFEQIYGLDVRKRNF